MHQHEAATTNIACAWQRDRQRKTCGDRRINRISATLKHVESRLRSEFLRARDHAFGGNGRDKASSVVNQRPTLVLGLCVNRGGIEGHRDGDEQAGEAHEGSPKLSV